MGASSDFGGGRKSKELNGKMNGGAGQVWVSELEKPMDPPSKHHLCVGGLLGLALG